MAARQSAPVIGALCSGSQPHGQAQAPRRQPWTLSFGYRFQPSSRHFVGTVEQKQREANGNQIQNTYHLFDVGVSRQITQRWTLNANLPVLLVYRNQLYVPRGEFRVRGLGDATVGGRLWLFRPPTESGGNVGLGMNLKLPTGVYNATGKALDRNGKQIIATADQSIQAGDGRLGFSLDLQAYKPLPFQSTVFFSGSWLFNPHDTNGVSTFRGGRGEEVMSVADQYLFRGGVSRAFPKVRGLTVTFGPRIEGVPVRDAFGKSNGFRRPGYALSLDPGFLYAYGSYVFSCNVPFAVQRNRRRSVPDYARGTHGDAAFADYALILGFTKRF